MTASKGEIPDYSQRNVLIFLYKTPNNPPSFLYFDYQDPDTVFLPMTGNMVYTERYEKTCLYYCDKKKLVEACYKDDAPSEDPFFQGIVRRVSYPALNIKNCFPRNVKIFNISRCPNFYETFIII